MEQAFIPIAQEMISNGGPEVILQLREPAPTRHSSAAVASVAAPASLSNSTTTNPNAKPCNACRRRKVRCDKSRPCLNCSRLGTACIYDHVVSTTLSGPGGEQSSAGSGIGVIAASNQQILQDRIERLERVIEGMSGLSVRGGSGGRGGGGSGSGGSRHVSPAATATSVSSGYHTMDDADGSGGAGGGGGSSREDHGIQVFEPNMCYYMGPNYWMNLHQFVYEPRYLLRVSGHGAGNRQAADLLLQAGNPALASLPFDMSAMHLSQDQEDLMFDLFFKNVEPFIRIMHRQTFRSDLQDFRTGFSKLEHEMRALVFSIQAVTVAALPSDVVLVTFGQSRHTLMDHFQLATELALSRANYLQSRMIACYQALLYYVVSCLEARCFMDGF